MTDRFTVKIDLHARQPRQEEDVKYDDRRVGKDSDEGVGLHGRTTPEAFAIDDLPTRIQVIGRRSDGSEVQATVLVSHPYASLNMKVKAAHDWLRAVRGDTRLNPYSEKHVFDVYLLVAMMLPGEFEECQALAVQYAGNPIAEEIRQNASDLFADHDGRASLEIQRQLSGLIYDYNTFWDALQGALGAGS